MLHSAVLGPPFNLDPRGGPGRSPASSGTVRVSRRRDVHDSDAQPRDLRSPFKEDGRGALAMSQEDGGSSCSCESAGIHPPGSKTRPSLQGGQKNGARVPDVERRIEVQGGRRNRKPENRRDFVERGPRMSPTARSITSLAASLLLTHRTVGKSVLSFGATSTSTRDISRHALSLLPFRNPQPSLEGSLRRAAHAWQAMPSRIQYLTSCVCLPSYRALSPTPIATDALTNR